MKYYGERDKYKTCLWASKNQITLQHDLGRNGGLEESDEVIFLEEVFQRLMQALVHPKVKLFN